MFSAFSKKGYVILIWDYHAKNSWAIQEEFLLKTQREILGGNDRHKIDYSRVGEKSRCAGRNRHICLILNEMWWSGRSDSN